MRDFPVPVSTNGFALTKERARAAYDAVKAAEHAVRDIAIEAGVPAYGATCKLQNRYAAPRAIRTLERLQDLLSWTATVASTVLCDPDDDPKYAELPPEDRSEYDDWQYEVAESAIDAAATDMQGALIRMIS